MFGSEASPTTWHDRQRIRPWITVKHPISFTPNMATIPVDHVEFFDWKAIEVEKQVTYPVTLVTKSSWGIVDVINRDEIRDETVTLGRITFGL